jgi:hypothetical protein
MSPDVKNMIVAYFKERAHWAIKLRDEAIKNKDEKLIELYSQLAHHYEGVYRQGIGIR